ncbi:Hypothetical protein, putative [Bodo saltans]|uniref:Uncharacterized protein n=1 Tax=Bodo saltans TaxID=75058 RepID=A0A0S4JPW7_BODSA|nr:Hypothetical protein, putative [Bodo saltans]|eukprot:CUG92292.1 Hypothetical protein, putative [Bodo saltans]
MFYRSQHALALEEDFIFRFQTCFFFKNPPPPASQHLTPQENEKSSSQYSVLKQNNLNNERYKWDKTHIQYAAFVGRREAHCLVDVLERVGRYFFSNEQAQPFLTLSWFSPSARLFFFRERESRIFRVDIECVGVHDSYPKHFYYFSNIPAPRGKQQPGSSVVSYQTINPVSKKQTSQFAARRFWV